MESTRVTTWKWSGDPPRADRTEVEYTDDYVDCMAGETLA